MDIDKYTNEIYLKSLSEEEKFALLEYTSSESGNINHMLRKQRNLFDIYESDIKLIDGALNKFDYKDDLILYRDLIIYGTKLNELLRELENGIVQEKGYYSCSLIEGAYAKLYNVRMKIIVPNTFSPGAYIKHLSDRPSEEEYLVKREIVYQTLDIQNIEDKYLITRKILC